jgi:Dienelactone hydrolase family
MRAGGVDWRMHLYGGVQHSFTHPHADRAGIPGLAYDPAAADRAWRAMLDLFEEVIGREAAPSHSWTTGRSVGAEAFTPPGTSRPNKLLT